MLAHVAAFVALGATFASGCVASRFDARYLPTDDVALELASMTPGLGAEARATFRDVLSTTLAEDAYTCSPSPREVFFGDVEEGERTIRGAMPHYRLFFGPMHYHVRRLGPRGGAPGRWEVSATFAVVLPREGGTLGLADCDGKDRYEGEVVCRGVPFSRSNTTEACPSSGEFRAPATRRNMEALLARWSEEAERYWNRDAERYGLPVRYDFTFLPHDQAAREGVPVDLTLPLSTTCGRTPYFWSLRSGWSLPVIAHEVGHLLGLMDEYEALSGIVPFYPKTPFPGAHTSRMGLSMKEDTILYPMHHWIVVRRYLCPEPSGRDPWGHAFQ
ncbi:hypothetical protein [Polyangium sp. 15x6]|uniref:hypothetical protein n=1 Tax=Polyangium sp. 15x6 TaxID=3042687 RepID=UPI002499BC82|nr:hypothetical protein [Polyangium sp. 15x6]MDI3282074.1 hypothetical protein [Polyangium sp. 15x6]